MSPASLPTIECSRQARGSVRESHITLNPSQRQRLLVTCKHIDKLLSDMEVTLSATTAKGIFPVYVDDISSVQRAVIERSIARIRHQLVQVLSTQSLAPEAPSISATHAINVSLTFVEIAIAELAPHYMRGYGPVSDNAASDLMRIMDELESPVDALRKGLSQYSPERDTQ